MNDEPIPNCMWCGQNGIMQTTWNKGPDNIWRCQFGHLAKIEIKRILDKKNKS